MIVGVCSVELLIYSTNSLKEKRHVIKSIIGRIKSRFNVSISEVDNNDKWQISTIGFSIVTNDVSHANSTISNVLNFIERDSRIEITNHFIEIL
ncbi:DUF503 domain-containing protein [Senegalia massiliensis]|uniref:DUF503 domain-containing protein n=1 Tax=Senegalia massiliensis TaxID=1720316 RepID=UPI00102FCA55|nr:DUF503 domain-containing protein [Senegalia massiliensis]